MAAGLAREAEVSAEGSDSQYAADRVLFFATYRIAGHDRHAPDRRHGEAAAEGAGRHLRRARTPARALAREREAAVFGADVHARATRAGVPGARDRLLRSRAPCARAGGSAARADRAAGIGPRTKREAPRRLLPAVVRLDRGRDTGRL